MEDKNIDLDEAIAEDEAHLSVAEEEDEPHEKTVRLMSPTQMVLRRFFRSKLSIVGLIMLLSLFIFCWVGPLLYPVDPSTQDLSGKIIYSTDEITYVDENGNEQTFYQVTETTATLNSLAKPSLEHPLGTDLNGRDLLARLMQGGKISLTISFLSVFLITFLGIIFGGVAGYFGGKIDTVIMRLCDILMCLPGIPILLIVGTILNESTVPPQYRIYLLMGFLTLISWSGTARLVRGQILSLREQEYMVAADAMGYSVGRRIFKHLIPNVIPQLIVSMTLSLGSMILYEASLSFLGIGAPETFAAWGTMINAANNEEVLKQFLNVWAPPGICIIVAVLGFNFIGDGLRDALDPRARR